MARFRQHGFTLIELLIVIGIVGLLASLLMPALQRAKEKAKVVKVKVELQGLGLALQMYADDHRGALPPVRVNCNTDMFAHWCQLPTELADQRYLPRGSESGREANMEDPFDPGHTYKYAAPGPQLVNGDPGSDFGLWVPGTFPRLDGTNGAFHTNPKTSPVRWVVWSLGPKPQSARSLNSRAPMGEATWYRRTGDSGVIVRYANREGVQFSSP
jgi:prepilin-type N-terminal cleavage/methylation domain-containing protein